MRNFWQKRRQQMQESSELESHSKAPSDDAFRMADLPLGDGSQSFDMSRGRECGRHSVINAEMQDSLQSGAQIESFTQQITVTTPGCLQQQYGSPLPSSIWNPDHGTRYTQAGNSEMLDCSQLGWGAFPGDDQDFASWMAFGGLDLGLDMPVDEEMGLPGSAGATEYT